MESKSHVTVNKAPELMEASNLSVGGHVLFAHYQQSMTDYLAIALLHDCEGVAVTDELDVTPARHFTGRAEGLSSFEARLLDSKIEYDKEAGTLMIKGLPTSLIDQLKGRN
jgi:nucleoid-associated protein YejK